MEYHNFSHLTLDNKYYDRNDISLFPEPFDNGLRLKDFLEDNDQMNRVYSNNGLSPTVTTKTGGGREVKILTDESTELLPRIRKLTPKECYRLMGFSDEDFEKAETVNSNTQLYRQAGNSIVVNVLEEIYKCLYAAYPNDFTAGMNVISLFSGIGAFEKALKKVDFENFTQPQSK